MSKLDAFCIRYLICLCALCMLGASAGIVAPFMLHGEPGPGQLSQSLQLGALAGMVAAFLPAAWLTHTNIDGLASPRPATSGVVASLEPEWKLRAR